MPSADAASSLDRLSRQGASTCAFRLLPIDDPDDPGPDMCPLAGRPFLKMNGLGNEIVVLDLRGTAIVVTPAEARAIAADGARFDQLMVLHDAATPAPTPSCASTTPTAREAGACGNGTRCVAWPDADELGADDADARDERRPALARARRRRPFTVDMGRAALRLARDPAGRAVPRHARVSSCRSARSTRRSCTRPRPSTWATRTPSSGSTTSRRYDLGRIGPLLENHPIFPERANISLAQ